MPANLAPILVRIGLSATRFLKTAQVAAAGAQAVAQGVSAIGNANSALSKSAATTSANLLTFTKRLASIHAGAKVVITAVTALGNKIASLSPSLEQAKRSFQNAFELNIFRVATNEMNAFGASIQRALGPGLGLAREVGRAFGTLAFQFEFAARTAETFLRGVLGPGIELQQTLAGVTSVVTDLNESFATSEAGIVQLQLDFPDANIEDAADALAFVRGRAEEVEEAILDVASATKFTVNEIASAAQFLGQTGLSASELIATLDPIAQLAQAGNLDVAKAADLATNALKAFSIETFNLSRVTNALAITAASANTNVEQLAQALKFVAPTAASLQFQIEEVSAAIGVLGNAGVQASIAGTSLENAFRKLAAPTNKFLQVLQRLGLTYDDVNPRFNTFTEILEKLRDRGATAGDIIEGFGVRGGRSINTLLNQGIEDIEALQKQIESLDFTALDISAQRTRNIIDELDRLRAQLSGISSAILKAVEGDIANAINFFSALLGRLQDFVKSPVGQEISKIFVAISASVAAAGRILATFFTLLGAPISLAGELPLLTQAFQAVTASISNLATLAAFAAENLRPVFTAIRNSIGTAISNLTSGALGQALSRAFDRIRATFAGLLQNVLRPLGIGVAEIFTQLQAQFNGRLVAIIDGLARGFENLVVAIQRNVPNILALIKAFAQLQIERFVGSLETLVSRLQNQEELTINISTSIALMKSFLELLEFADKIFQRIAQAASRVVQITRVLVSQFASLIGGGIGSFLGSFLGPPGILVGGLIGSKIGKTFAENFKKAAESIADPLPFPELDSEGRKAAIAQAEKQSKELIDAVKNFSDDNLIISPDLTFDFQQEQSDALRRFTEDILDFEELTPANLDRLEESFSKLGSLGLSDVIGDLSLIPEKLAEQAASIEQTIAAQEVIRDSLKKRNTEGISKEQAAENTAVIEQLDEAIRRQKGQVSELERAEEAARKASVQFSGYRNIQKDLVAQKKLSIPLIDNFAQVMANAGVEAEDAAGRIEALNNEVDDFANEEKILKLQLSGEGAKLELERLRQEIDELGRLGSDASQAIDDAEAAEIKAANDRAAVAVQRIQSLQADIARGEARRDSASAAGNKTEVENINRSLEESRRKVRELREEEANAVKAAGQATTQATAARENLKARRRIAETKQKLKDQEQELELEELLQESKVELLEVSNNDRQAIQEKYLQTLDDIQTQKKDLFNGTNQAEVDALEKNLNEIAQKRRDADLVELNEQKRKQAEKLAQRERDKANEESDLNVSDRAKQRVGFEDDIAKKLLEQATSLGDIVRIYQFLIAINQELERVAEKSFRKLLAITNRMGDAEARVAEARERLAKAAGDPRREAAERRRLERSQKELDNLKVAQNIQAGRVQFNDDQAGRGQRANVPAVQAVRIQPEIGKLLINGEVPELAGKNLGNSVLKGICDALVAGTVNVQDKLVKMFNVAIQVQANPAGIQGGINPGNIPTPGNAPLGDLRKLTQSSTIGDITINVEGIADNEEIADEIRDQLVGVLRGLA